VRGLETARGFTALQARPVPTVTGACRVKPQPTVLSYCKEFNGQQTYWLQFYSNVRRADRHRSTTALLLCCRSHLHNALVGELQIQRQIPRRIATSSKGPQTGHSRLSEFRCESAVAPKALEFATTRRATNRPAHVVNSRARKSIFVLARRGLRRFRGLPSNRNASKLSRSDAAYGGHAT
jgi:hypothetical protein